MWQFHFSVLQRKYIIWFIHHSQTKILIMNKSKIGLLPEQVNLKKIIN